MATVKEAAKHFGVRPGTIRKYIRKGLPCVREGSIGRGHVSIIDLKDAERWIVTERLPYLARKAEYDVLKVLETGIYDCLKRDGLTGKVLPAEQTLLLLFQRLFKNITHRELQQVDLSEEMKLVAAIYLSSR